jgi:hypothetical protein
MVADVADRDGTVNSIASQRTRGRVALQNLECLNQALAEACAVCAPSDWGFERNCDISPTGERAAFGRITLDVLGFTGRSFGCVRGGQVGTKTLPQMGCGSQNRESVEYNHSELLNSPASSADGTDHAHRTRTSATPNVQFQFAMMTSSHIPRTILPLLTIIASSTGQ